MINVHCSCFTMPGTCRMCLALMLFAVSVVGSSSEERPQQQNLAQVFNNLRVQIQNYERSLAECRRHVQLLTGQATRETANYWQPGFANWAWLGAIDDRKRRGSETARRDFNGNYWSNNYGQLQNTLQTRVREWNQCTTQLQAIRSAQRELSNKEQVANNLLQQVNAGAINLRACVNAGGRTNVDLPALFRYVANGGFIQPHNTAPSYQNYRDQANSQLLPWAMIGSFEFDDRRRAEFDDGRRAVMPSHVDWDQVLAQRQQWQTFVQEAVIRCWASLGRLPDGTLPKMTIAPAITATTPRPLQLPPLPSFPQPPPAMTRTSTTPKARPTTKQTTERTTPKPATTTRSTTNPTTYPTTTTTMLPTTPLTTTTTVLPTTPNTTTTVLPTTTSLPPTTTTVFFTTTTGPGLTTTFALPLTTTPC